MLDRNIAALASESAYDILGVDKGASLGDIKKAYREASLKYHPDKNPGDAIAEAQFKKIQTAYEVVGDQSLRAEYDKLPVSANGRPAQAAPEKPGARQAEPAQPEPRRPEPARPSPRTQASDEAIIRNAFPGDEGSGITYNIRELSEAELRQDIRALHKAGMVVQKSTILQGQPEVNTAIQFVAPQVKLEEMQQTLTSAGIESEIRFSGTEGRNVLEVVEDRARLAAIMPAEIHYDTLPTRSRAAPNAGAAQAGAGRPAPRTQASDEAILREPESRSDGRVNNFRQYAEAYLRQDIRDLHRTGMVVQKRIVRQGQPEADAIQFVAPEAKLQEMKNALNSAGIESEIRYSGTEGKKVLEVVEGRAKLAAIMPAEIHFDHLPSQSRNAPARGSPFRPRGAHGYNGDTPERAGRFPTAPERVRPVDASEFDYTEPRRQTRLEEFREHASAEPKSVAPLPAEPQAVPKTAVRSVAPPEMPAPRPVGEPVATHAAGASRVASVKAKLGKGAGIVGNVIAGIQLTTEVKSILESEASTGVKAERVTEAVAGLGMDVAANLLTVGMAGGAASTEARGVKTIVKESITIALESKQLDRDLAAGTISPKDYQSRYVALDARIDAVAKRAQELKGETLAATTPVFLFNASGAAGEMLGSWVSGGQSTGPEPVRGNLSPDAIGVGGSDGFSTQINNISNDSRFGALQKYMNEHQLKIDPSQSLQPQINALTDSMRKSKYALQHQGPLSYMGLSATTNRQVAAIDEAQKQLIDYCAACNAVDQARHQTVTQYDRDRDGKLTARDFDFNGDGKLGWQDRDQIKQALQSDPVLRQLLREGSIKFDGAPLVTEARAITPSPPQKSSPARG